MKLSILTATYNRADRLPELYESLKNNLKYDLDFEWLIMDDGSTDNTYEVIENFAKEGLMNIHYYRQENQGKMVAINNLVEISTGDLIIDCDSDDYFAGNAFGIIKENAFKLLNDSELYALLFLRCDVSGEISGKKFIEDNYRTSMFDLYFREDIQGEKIVLFNGNIRRKYKHRLEPGEKFVTEARLYHEMDKDYDVLCINEPIVIGGYQSDGYSKNIKKIFTENPKGHLKYFEEILNFDTENILFKKRLYAIKHYILFSYLTKNRHFIKPIKGRLNKFLIAILYIPGCIKTKLMFKSSMKKLFISSWTLDVGGIEKSLVNLVNALCDKYEITLALEKKKGIFLGKIDPRINIIEYTPSEEKNILLRKYQNLIKRIKFIVKYKSGFDAAISFATYSRPGAFMARTASRNNTLWIHSNYLTIYKNNTEEIKKFFNTVKPSKFKNIVCVSEEAKEAFLLVFPKLENKISVINNLVNFEEILELSKEKIDLYKHYDTTFLSVCRHEEEAKKLTRLIEAARILKEEHFNFRILMVGEGKDTEMYKKMVEEYNLKSNIIFCGMQKNPYPYFLISDCIIITSEYEGYPVVFTEAKVLNKPIITTNVSDSILDVENKFGIVTQKNVKDIKEAMQEFIEKGYEIKENFDPKKFNNDIMKKIEKLIN